MTPIHEPLRGTECCRTEGLEGRTHTCEEGRLHWLGSTILANIIIGENSIVGAGSVVTRNVPADAIAAGNPAKVLRTSQPNQGLTMTEIAKFRFWIL